MNNKIEDIMKYHKKSFEELPEDIKNESIRFLKSLLSEDDVNAIIEDFNRCQDTWWASSHFTWGMWIRNLLRDNVCLDDKLPSGNWDDYYVPLIEGACGLR